MQCGTVAHHSDPEIHSRVVVKDVWLRETWDENEHIAHGTIVAEQYCADCGQAIDGTQQVLSQDGCMRESHSFEYMDDGSKICTGCGYVQQYVSWEDCSHEETTVERWGRIRQFTGMTDTHQLGVGDVVEVERCALCYEWLDRRIVERNVPVSVAHTIPIDVGYCINCMYVPACLHENSVERFEPRGGMFAPEDEQSHAFSGLASRYFHCSDCGRDFSTEAQWQKKELISAQLPHRFDGGICTDCGYEAGA